MMRIAYLPTNQAWALLFGSEQIDLDGRTLWNSREGLVWDLEAKGLGVCDEGIVHQIDPAWARGDFADAERAQDAEHARASAFDERLVFWDEEFGPIIER